MNRMDQYSQSRLRTDPSIVISAEPPTTIHAEASHISPGPADTAQTSIPSPVHVSPSRASPTHGAAEPSDAIPPEADVHNISDDGGEPRPVPPPPQRNPFEGHPDLAPDYEGRRPDDPNDDYILPRNPLARIIDETKKIGEANITSRLVSLCDDTRNLEGYHGRLLKASEEVGRANVRLRLEAEDARRALKEKEAELARIKAEQEAALQRAREEAKEEALELYRAKAKRTQKRVTDWCETEIKSALDLVDTNMAEVQKRLSHFRGKVAQMEQSLLALQGEHAVMDAQKEKLQGEVAKLKGELSEVNQTRELYMNKVVEL